LDLRGGYTAPQLQVNLGIIKRLPAAVVGFGTRAHLVDYPAAEGSPFISSRSTQVA
jgi:hypothetical protein